MHRQKYKIGCMSFAELKCSPCQREYSKPASDFILKDVELLHLQFAKSKLVFPKTSNNLVFHFDGVAESLCQQSVEKPNEFFFLCVDRRVVSGTRVGRRRINRIRVATVWRRRGAQIARIIHFYPTPLLLYSIYHPTFIFQLFPSVSTGKGGMQGFPKIFHRLFQTARLDLTSSKGWRMAILVSWLSWQSSWHF